MEERLLARVLMLPQEQAVGILALLSCQPVPTSELQSAGHPTQDLRGSHDQLTLIRPTMHGLRPWSST